MNKQLMALGLAAALGGSPAYAANSDALTEDGTGDVLLVARNAANTETLLWDLSKPGDASDLVASDFYRFLTGPFSISNPAVDTWVGDNIGAGPITFNIFGLSEIKAFDPNPFPPNPGHPDWGGVVTVANLQLQDSGADVFSSVEGLQGWVDSGANFAPGGLADNGVAVVDDPANNAFFGRLSHDTNLFGMPASTTVNGGAIDFFYVQGDPTLVGANDGTAQAQAAPLATFLGRFAFNFDAGVAELSYQPVPVPGAVWLLGSALLGLSGARRRG